MKPTFNVLAKAAGIAGVLMCITAVIGRFTGEATSVLGSQAINIFMVGVGLMVFDCMVKLECKE